jgi:hypothetical protein
MQDLKQEKLDAGLAGDTMESDWKKTQTLVNRACAQTPGDSLPGHGPGKPCNQGLSLSHLPNGDINKMNIFMC